MPQKYIALVILAALIARSPAAAKEAGCDTAARVAAFEKLLKAKPTRAAVEAFIEKNRIFCEKGKRRSRMAVSISEADCNPIDYQHPQHIFDITFEHDIAASFSESTVSGGP